MDQGLCEPWFEEGGVVLDVFIYLSPRELICDPPAPALLVEYLEKKLSLSITCPATTVCSLKKIRY